jgi:hypothetical protein
MKALQKLIKTAPENHFLHPLITSAVIIDIGETADEMEKISSYEMCRPPFENTIVNLEKIDGHEFQVLITDTGDGVECHGISTYKSSERNRSQLTPFMLKFKGYNTIDPEGVAIFDYNSESWLPEGFSNLQKFMLQNSFNNLWIAAYWKSLAAMEVIACSNVELIDNIKKPPYTEQRKAKNKNLPLFTYKTLHIKTSITKAKQGDSTQPAGKSPRLHLRRGHIRRLGENRIWVKSCVVGSKEQGIIHKDYKITH